MDDLADHSNMFATSKGQAVSGFNSLEARSREGGRAGSVIKLLRRQSARPRSMRRIVNIEETEEAGAR